MELDDFKMVWQANDVKLEKSLHINEQNIESIQAKKVRSKLTPFYRQRMTECISHSIVIVLLLAFLFSNLSQFPYAMSAIALLAFYVTTLVNAVKQLNLISSIDVNSDLATMQSSLVKLQTHIVDYAKLTVLFIPTFLAYPTVITKMIKDFDIKALADFDIIQKSNGAWWNAELMALIILVPLGIWFYKEVTYKNIEKQWVKNFIQKSTGTRVTKALEFLKELQDLRRNSN